MTILETKPPKDELSDKETAERLEAALRRALVTPPKKHEPDKPENPKPNPKRRRAR